jgi:hypothetical protein
MTQKSSARLARDAVKKAEEYKLKQAAKLANDLKDNSCFNDLNDMYHSMVLLLSKHAHLNEFAANKELIAAVADKITLVANIRMLARDLTTLNADLSAIHELHKDKTGGSRDPDEIISTINIFEQYNLFMERHNAVIMPIAYHIIEQFDTAEKLLMRVAMVNKAATDLLDPNVISDVEIITEEPKAKTVGLDLLGVVHESVTQPDFDKLTASFIKLHDLNVAEE